MEGHLRSRPVVFGHTARVSLVSPGRERPCAPLPHGAAAVLFLNVKRPQGSRGSPSKEPS
ncbi:predicted protein [Streptomyces viridosporus ATCC 14672]|uniref:Predicted protein n=1 Tax=Streptomyces viridosporus (strain ATCC 14672 / DSM 40746 / JCM 4963 / KCTC 9882 / NRRL B-12104 / FH 1290) TaxID=566461 RepID=D6A857_STRV1|nr:predicted protein [Streptomyces viridosporus ATCC 14672]